MPDEHEAEEWLILAGEDLEAASVLINVKPPLVASVLFHCQQAAEKALKSVIARAGEVPPRIHHLVPLLQRATNKRADLGVLLDAATRLSSFAVAPRYPGMRANTPEQAHSALDDARQIVVAVRGEP